MPTVKLQRMDHPAASVRTRRSCNYGDAAAFKSVTGSEDYVAAFAAVLASSTADVAGMGRLLQTRLDQGPLDWIG